MTFETPRKCILSQEQLTAFQSSKTHQEIFSYIESLNDAVIGVKLTDDCPASKVRVQQLLLITLLLFKSRVSNQYSTHWIE